MYIVSNIFPFFNPFINYFVQTALNSTICCDAPDFLIDFSLGLV